MKSSNAGLLACLAARRAALLTYSFLFSSLLNAADPALLKSSRDPKLLLETALDCARSTQPAAQDALLAALSTPDFLNRLDTRQDYLAPPRQLRLARVLDALAQNPAAHPTLTALTTQRAFTSLEPRQELLIRALAAVRPAPEPAIRFWEAHSAPESPYLTVTIDALADNGSDPALGLLASRLASPRYDREDRVAWMRDAVLRHRNEPAMLAMSRRLLTGPLTPDLRPDLIEALFDYHESWYLSDAPPVRPDPRRATPEARAILRQIGEWSLRSVRLTPPQKTAVQKALAAMEQ